MITRQHFTRAAEMVRAINEGYWTADPPDWADPDCSDEEYVRAVQTAEAFILLFSEFNPQFRTEKFLVACGLKGRSARREKVAR